MLVAAALFAAPATAVDFHYAAAVQQSAPWPTMRRDIRNTGASPIVGIYRGDLPWKFRTGKGIFSTPVVGGDGTVYFGSADTWFYALAPNGRLEWKFKTGNLIDSAGFIGAWNPKLKTNPVAVPSGDTYLYLLRSNRRKLTRKQRIIWRYTPPRTAGPADQVPLVNWWEGNAEPGPDGTIYAGSTGDAAYALHPNGTLKWVFRSFGPFWTDPAIAADGTTYWGSLDLQVHAISASGASVWRLPTLGFVISSPALSNSGTLYIGSFDSDLYAINTATGLPLWKFQTGDDIYGSPALDEDASGAVRAIYVSSTDGKVYALDPNGKLLWSYDTGDVIRSSPVIGIAPDGVHKIVYVGSGNGKLFALNAADGTRRWSYDTTLADPVLRDRNDLNASPALTKTGVVIGSEDGFLYDVPYDYCLHHSDPRCDTSPGQAFPPNMTSVFPVTPGGSMQIAGGVQQVGPAPVMFARLAVTHAGQTLDASMGPVAGGAASLVQATPSFPFTAQLSGDGRYLFVVASTFLKPGTYKLRIHGLYNANGVGIGDVRLGATAAGPFDQTLTYKVAPPTGPVPLRATPSKVSAFKLTRLSFPLPPFITSVNQIGFDAYDMIVGVLSMTRPDASGGGSVLLWAIGAHPGPHGIERADPATTLGFPLAGRYDGNALDLSAANPTLTFSFGPVPVQRLVMRATLSPSLTAKPGASIYAEVECATVPTYGPLLPSQRLCNQNGQVISGGTYITGPYSRGGVANLRPAGVSVRSLVMSAPSAAAAGSAVATLSLRRGARYPASAHVVSIVLTDAASGTPVGIDYRADTTQVEDRHGNVVGARLTLPAGTSLPASVRAYVVTDVFPLASRVLPG